MWHVTVERWSLYSITTLSFHKKQQFFSVCQALHICQLLKCLTAVKMSAYTIVNSYKLCTVINYVCVYCMDRETILINDFGNIFSILCELIKQNNNRNILSANVYKLKVTLVKWMDTIFILGNNYRNPYFNPYILWQHSFYYYQNKYPTRTDLYIVHDMTSG